MECGRVNHPLKYRRARTLLYAVLAFWLWAWLGSGAFIAGLFATPLYALVAMYALAVAVLVSIPLAMLAVLRMLINRSRTAASTVVVPLVLRPAPPAAPHWWYDGMSGDKVS